jgi:hypothetical protein
MLVIKQTRKKLTAFIKEPYFLLRLRYHFETTSGENYFVLEILRLLLGFFFKTVLRATMFALILAILFVLLAYWLGVPISCGENGYLQNGYCVYE